MTRATRRTAIASAAALAVAALAAGAWWFDAQTRPAAVARRIATLVTARHAGANVAPIDANLLRVTMLSGLYIDIRIAAVTQACRDDRFDCSSAIERIAADVERAASLAAHPRFADLRAMVVGETTPGFRFGFVTEPLIGALEVRYALVAGAASTFVTSAIADRLGAGRAQLKDAALKNLAAEGEPRAELLSVPPGAYRVISKDDPVVNLLDAGRMRKLAVLVGSPRILWTVPERDTLLLARADAAGERALASVHSGPRPGEAGSGAAALFLYDTHAPKGQRLSEAEAPLIVR